MILQFQSQCGRCPFEFPDHDMKSVRWESGGVVSLLKTEASSLPLTRAASETCQETFAHNFDFTERGSGTVVSSRLFQYSRARGVVPFAARVSVIRIPVTLTPTNAHKITSPEIVTSPIYRHSLYSCGSCPVMKPTPRKRFHLAFARHTVATTFYCSIIA